jgi:hypothetical protein
MAGTRRSILSKQKLEMGILLAIITLAYALRLVHLGVDSLWYDETVSTFLAGQPIADLVGHTARDVHPPGYYLALKTWLTLTGFPTGRAAASGYGLEFMAAFLSAGFGVLLIPLAWQLARRLCLPHPAPLLAAFLAAISPFGIWYSQEVRMYTMGASLGLVTLLATIPFLYRAPSIQACRRAAVAYAGSTAAALYMLYYTVFLVVALNALVLPWLLADRRRRPQLLVWLAAQAGALLLYLPWLPVAMRQATDPPVPPWRTLPTLPQALVESWTALSFGQSAIPGRFGVLLLVTAGLVAIAIAWGLRWTATTSGPGPEPWPQPAGNSMRRPEPGAKRAVAFLLAASFGPPILIYLVSLVTPLYHVRYLFTYSPTFSVLVALGLAVLGHWRWPLGRWLMAGAVVLMGVGSALSLHAFWTDPGLTADDHRAAVRELAERWRPGEPILVNAGYAYPTLLTYWPLPVTWHGRLSELDPAILSQAQATQGAVILQTGHIDGDPGLGWGDRRSDFYALPSDVLQEQLGALAGSGTRLWHYRIYDTVNDPNAALRAQLANNWRLFDDRVYPGEANLRVQGFQPYPPADDANPGAAYGDQATLEIPSGAVPDTVVSGDFLDVRGVAWTVQEGDGDQALAISLRLVDDRDEVWAVHDEPLGGNVEVTEDGLPLLQPLRLMVPVGTPPGKYRLALVVYEASSGMALTPTEGPLAAGQQAVLGDVEVQRPSPPPVTSAVLADFGQLRLVEASSPATVVSPADEVPVALLWQAAPTAAPETLVAVVQLLDERGQVAASLEEEPGQGRYPTSAWQPGELVRDRQRLALPASLLPGRYQLIVGLYRATDRSRLLTKAGQDHALIQEIEVR